MMNKLKPISRLIIALSALLMVSAFFVPLWQILMWAPQYPEGLEMKIWINTITGDVKIISALNHYIGMKHIEPSMFPEFQYMGYIVAGLIAFGILAALVNRRFMVVAFASLIVISGIAALVDFYLWGYDYGHNLDPTAPIIVPGMAYQPPIIGTKQLLNFTAFSGPDIGGWIFFIVGMSVIGVLAFEIYLNKKKRIIKNKLSVAGNSQLAAMLIAFAMISCNVQPEPLHFGKDACYTCKMTLMDKKFGAEVVTKKGKVYKFDDVNCMINVLNSGFINKDEVAFRLIVDCANPEKLIDAQNAFYLKSDLIKSPMASHVAAFEKQEDMEKFKKEWKGILLSWGELVTQFK